MFGSHAEAQTWRTMTSSRQLWGPEAVEVDIHYGAGTLRIDPADPGVLYEMQIHYDHDRSVPIIEWDEENRELELGARLERLDVDLGPRDQIDIQSFLWILGSDEYADERDAA